MEEIDFEKMDINVDLHKYKLTSEYIEFCYLIHKSLKKILKNILGPYWFEYYMADEYKEAIKLRYENYCKGPQLKRTITEEEKKEANIYIYAIRLHYKDNY